MRQEHLIATVQSNEILRTWIKSDKRVEERLLLKSVPYQNGAFNRYQLGLVSTYLCTHHRTEEFITELANYVVA